MALTEDQKAQIVEDILVPSDCVDKGFHLPRWADILTDVALFAPGPVGWAAAATVVSSIPTNTCGADSISRVRLSAITAAAAQRVFEAIPALVSLLGVDFIEGRDRDNRPTVVFTQRTPTEKNPIVRSIVMNALAHFIDAVPRDQLPEVVGRGAVAAVRAQVQDQDSRVASAASNAFVIINDRVSAIYGPAESLNPSTKISKSWPWVLAGGVGLAAAVVLIVRARHRDTIHEGAASHAQLRP